MKFLNKVQPEGKNYSKLSLFICLFTACNKNRWMSNKLAKRTMRFIIYSSRSKELSGPREENRELWKKWKGKIIKYNLQWTHREARNVRCELGNIKFTIFFFNIPKTAQSSRGAYGKCLRGWHFSFRNCRHIHNALYHTAWGSRERVKSVYVGWRKLCGKINIFCLSSHHTVFAAAAAVHINWTRRHREREEEKIPSHLSHGFLFKK